MLLHPPRAVLFVKSRGVFTRFYPTPPALALSVPPPRLSCPAGGQSFTVDSKYYRALPRSSIYSHARCERTPGLEREKSRVKFKPIQPPPLPTLPNDNDESLSVCVRTRRCASEGPDTTNGYSELVLPRRPFLYPTLPYTHTQYSSFSSNPFPLYPISLMHYIYTLALVYFMYLTRYILWVTVCVYNLSLSQCVHEQHITTHTQTHRRILVSSPRTHTEIHWW